MAVHAIIPIINALFQMHKNVADIKWLEIETSLTKRHKFDGVIFELSSKNRLTSTLMEFAKAECTDAKRQSDIAKVYHNAKRSMSQIASHVKSPNVPRVFVVLSSNNHLLFEALNLVKDNMYVRRRYARLDMPTSAKDLQKWVTFLPNVFAWRNAVCSSVDLIMNSSDDDLDETYDVSSVGSTP
jgi:hypothetical protein